MLVLRNVKPFPSYTKNGREVDHVAAGTCNIKTGNARCKKCVYFVCNPHWKQSLELSRFFLEIISSKLSLDRTEEHHVSVGLGRSPARKGWHGRCQSEYSCMRETATRELAHKAKVYTLPPPSHCTTQGVGVHVRGWWHISGGGIHGWLG